MDFVDWMLSQVGKRYVLGATGPDAWDCSGLIQWAAKQVGVSLPRVSGDQGKRGEQVSVEAGLRVRGAILWKPGHVAVAVGDGSTVEAVNPKNGVRTLRNQDGRGWVHACLVDGLFKKDMGVAVVPVSPVEGRVSSEFGKRGSGFHAGIDIATGRTGVAVYAMYAGVVERVVRGRKHMDRSRTNQLASGRTGNGVIVRNPDGERQLYGHVDSGLRPGVTVRAGDALGRIDLSGVTTGPHLHFEVWNKRGALRNPRVDFVRHRIVPGSKPRTAVEAPSVPVAAPKPSPKPVARPGLAKPSGRRTDGNRRVQVALKAAGYYNGLLDGVEGPRHVEAVYDYQKAQKYPGGGVLRPDGLWGPRTDSHWGWVRDLQTKVNGWQSSRPKLRVDGDLGNATVLYVRDVQVRNREGAYRRAGGRVADGVPGPVFCKMIGLRKHPLV